MNMIETAGVDVCRHKVPSQEWLLVPKEPDRFMRAAGQWTVSPTLVVTECVRNAEKAAEIYTAMINRAPQPDFDPYAEISRLKDALREIAYDTEVHTKSNQERLCCKFQHIAMTALGDG